MDDVEFHTTCTQIRQKADEVRHQVETWADFANALFATGGIVAEAFPERSLRQKFLKTTEYHDLRDWMDELMAKHGLVEGASPKVYV